MIQTFHQVMRIENFIEAKPAYIVNLLDFAPASGNVEAKNESWSEINSVIDVESKYDRTSKYIC